MKLLVGTSKGLVLWERKEQGWSLSEVFFPGIPVSMVHVNPADGYWYLSLAHRHWGQKMEYSPDQGKTWQSMSPPAYPAHAKLSEGKRATLKKVWAIQGAGLQQDKGLWIGTEPGGLFRSRGQGEDFHLVQGLWDHPSRKDRMQWFGAGRDQPFIHSILIDPRDEDHLYVGVSCAGVFETLDGGKSWHPKNKGLVAAYLPNPVAEVGHDPHAIKFCLSHPEVMWQQNHCGIFRTTNGGEEWKLVSDPGKIPHYGFALVADEGNPLRAWVIPAQSDEERIASDLALRVFRTEDGGKSWEALTQGLPQRHAFDIVFRHSFEGRNETLAFGTSTGNLFVSEDGGDHWQVLSQHLARIESLALVN